MKDIYSPLDIDEEWDNMAPMVDAPVMGGTEGATAVAVKPEAEMSTPEVAETAISTLPPTTEAPAEMPNNNMASGLKESTEEDAAFQVANADMGMNTMAANTDDKLNIAEISPTATAAASPTEVAMPSADEMPKAEAKETATTPIPVIDMNEANSTPAAESITMPGESFAPEEKPTTGDRFEGMEAEENEDAPKEAKPETPKEEAAKPEEPAAAELPVTPADKEVSKFGSNSKNEMKFDMNEAPSVSHSKLESLMSDWEDMKQRTQDRLNDLKSEKEDMLAKLEQELKDTQDKISATEAERDDIDAKLNELV